MAFCDTCRIGFSLPPLDDEALASFYPEVYEAYTLRTGLRAKLQTLKYAMDMNLIRSRVPKGRLFEIGAGRGEFLKAARDAGYEVTGLEPSAAGRKTAKDLFQINLTEGYGTEVRFSEPQDVIVARHSLEHMNEPLRALKKAHGGLRPGGLILLKLPTMDSWERRFFGKYWAGWDLPRHRIHFTPDGITRALNQVGFVDIDVKREIVPIDWVQSLIYMGRFGESALARASGKLLEALPSPFRLVIGQIGGLILGDFQPGRMIVTARRP